MLIRNKFKRSRDEFEAVQRELSEEMWSEEKEKMIKRI